MKRRNNGMKIAIIAALVISLMAIGVGFATFSTNLKIEGTAKVVSSNWDVHFSQIQRDNANSTTGVGTTLPIITNNTDANTNNTLINAFNVTFEQPGQKVTYLITVENAGDYNAYLSGYYLGSKSCSNDGTANGPNDTTNVCNKIKFTLTYADGSAITTGATLASGATAQLKLTVEYEDVTDASLLPKDRVRVNLGTTALTYSQV